MTADEIRGFELYNHEPGNMNAWDSAFFLKEIAAQLASANELKRIEMGIDPEPIPTPRVDWSKANAMAHAADAILAVIKPSPADIVKTPMDEYISKIAALRNAVDDYTEVPF
jgi:hypothetical protein